MIDVAAIAIEEATLNALLSLRQREDIYKSRGLQLRKVEKPKAPEAIPASS